MPATARRDTGDGNGRRPVPIDQAMAAVAVLRAAAALDRDAARRDREFAARLLEEASRHEAAAEARRDEAARLLQQAARERAASTIDDVTGALVRRHGLTVLEGEVERARRADGLMVIGFVDVDRLKRVNDEQGHAAGDALLHEVVAVLQKSVRRYDAVVRYGGDEFVFSLAGATLAAARRRARRMAAQVGERTGGAGVSIGLAALHPDDTLATVIARADADLYARRRARRRAS